MIDAARAAHRRIRALTESEYFGDQFVGPAAEGVIIGSGEDHRLICPIEFNQLLDSSFDSRWAPVIARGGRARIKAAQQQRPHKSRALVFASTGEEAPVGRSGH